MNLRLRKAGASSKPKRFTVMVRHRDIPGAHEVSHHATRQEAHQHMQQQAFIAGGTGRKHYMTPEGEMRILKPKSDETESSFWVKDHKTGRMAKALVYNPKTGDSSGTVQHEGKTLRFAKPTFGNKARAFLAGEKFMPNRPLPAAHLTPHALSRSLSPVHSTMRGMGLQFHSTIGPVKGLHEFTHVVTSPHNSADATIGALHSRLKQTHKVTKPLWTGKNWAFTATAKDGQRHHFIAAENHHVQPVHTAFAAFGNVRAKTSQAALPSGGHRYMHEVQTALPGAARDIFAQHFATNGFKVRKGPNALHLTHSTTGVQHKLTFKQAPQLGPHGAVPAVPPSPTQQRRPAPQPASPGKKSAGRGSLRRSRSAVPA